MNTVLPSVWLISRPTLEIGNSDVLRDNQQWWGLPEHPVSQHVLSEDNTDGGSMLAEIAGRIDYLSFSRERRRPGGARNYFHHILEYGHENIIEIPHYVFVVRCSQGIAREVLRYRTMERSQTSTRYVDYSAMPLVWYPGAPEPDPDWDALWRQQYVSCYEDKYGYAMINLKLSPRDARKYARSVAQMYLPFSVVTWLVLAMNVRSYRNMLLQRMTPEAHPEFYYLASYWWEIAKEEFPLLIQDIEECVAVNGMVYLSKKKGS